MHVNMLIERTRSRTGKHASYSNAFLVTSEGKVSEARARSRREARGTYARGSAVEALLEPPGPGEVLVAVTMRRNLRGRVHGTLVVYDGEAGEVLRAVYRKLKVRRSRGDPGYEWAIRAVMDHLKLPVKRYNMSTGTR